MAKGSASLKEEKIRCSAGGPPVEEPMATMSMLAAVHCGANFILHSAGFLDGLLSMSYEKFVMDTDFCGALHSYLAGVRVDDLLELAYRGRRAASEDAKARWDRLIHYLRDILPA